MSAIYDGTRLNAPLVVFLVILGAGFTVVMGFAINRLYHLADRDLEENQFDRPSDSQRNYMRQVRLRNQMHALVQARNAISGPARAN